MKRILALVLILICILTAVPFALAEEAAECPYSLFVYDLPKGIKKANEQAGTVHEEHYTAHRYSPEGEALEERDGVLYV